MDLFQPVMDLRLQLLAAEMPLLVYRPIKTEASEDVEKLRMITFVIHISTD